MSIFFREHHLRWIAVVQNIGCLNMQKQGSNMQNMVEQYAEHLIDDQYTWWMTGDVA